MTSSVSVIVLNYNGADLLCDCLPSLEEQSHESLEILVADNGSDDESDAVVDRHEARFLDFGENLGFGQGNNRAAEHADGDYLFFVNNDMRFREYCVEHQVSFLENHPEYFGLSCTQFDWDGEHIVYLANKIERNGLTGTTFPFVEQYGVDTDSVTAVPWACAGNLMVDAEKFSRLDGFDDTFFLNVEDVDLCFRAWMRGWPSVYLPAKDDNFVHHKVSETGLSWRGYSTQKNMVRFLLKTMPAPLLVKFLTGKAIQGTGALALGRFSMATDIWRGLLANVLEMRSTLDQRREIRSESKYPLNTILENLLDAEYPVAPEEILP